MKILWVDVETTGLDSAKNGIIQLSCIVDIDGEVKDTLNLFVKPFPTDEIVPEALEVTGTKIEDLAGFMNPNEALAQMKSMMSKYIDPYKRGKTKNDKFYWGGHNTQFDINFVQEFFKKCGDKFFGSWFNYRQIDTLRMADFLVFGGRNFGESHKLGDLCKIGNVKLNAHDSMSDISASREIAYRFKALLK